MNYFSNAYIVSLSFLVFSCENEPFITNLDNTILQTQEANTTNFKFKSYQVPPNLGGLYSIYVGKQGGYDATRTLLEFESHEILRWANFQVDSGYFQFTVDSNFVGQIPEESHITLGFFRRNSNYSELESNYTNVDWILKDYPKLTSRFLTDSTGLTYLQFPLDSVVVQTLADTSEGSWLYLLESPPNADYFLKFYSSESPVYRPFLSTFMHSTSTNSDTSDSIDSTRIFEGQSDVTLFIPPILSSTNFDSSFSYVGVATGFVTILKPNIPDLGIPKQATIARAKLTIPIDNDGSSTSAFDSLFFQVYALEDTVTNWSWGEVLREDIYAHHTATFASSASSTPMGSSLKLDVTDLLQSVISERETEQKNIVDLGFKLKMVSSQTIFDYVAMRTDSSAIGQASLEVLFEIP